MQSEIKSTLVKLITPDNKILAGRLLKRSSVSLDHAVTNDHKTKTF